MSKEPGKVIAITGASSDIGHATARRISSAGYAVMLGARREERLVRLSSDIRDAGGLVHFRRLDVTQRDSMNSFINETISYFGRARCHR